MNEWKINFAERPLQFPGVYDAFENFRNHKDSVYESSGVQDFEMKAFTFGNG
jgi:hypothetical protein